MPSIAARVCASRSLTMYCWTITLVRMVVIDWQRGGAGKPKKLSALDLDGRYERHEHVLVVVWMVDDLHVLALRLGGYGGENHGGYAKRGEREHSAKRCPDHRFLHFGVINDSR